MRWLLTGGRKRARPGWQPRRSSASGSSARSTRHRPDPGPGTGQDRIGAGRTGGNREEPGGARPAEPGSGTHLRSGGERVPPLLPQPERQRSEAKPAFGVFLSFFPSLPSSSYFFSPLFLFFFFFFLSSFLLPSSPSLAPGR